MAIELRPWTAILILVLVLALGTAGSAVVADVASSQQYDATNDYLTVNDPPEASGTHIWPYTTQATGYGSRTLAINVLIYGDVDTTERQLRVSSRGNWNETDDEEEDVDLAEGQANANGTATAWHTAEGSTRYVPMREGGNTIWLTESYQLHDGDYLGTRYHLRAYTAPNESQKWTAVQTHREHWDWFRLRHTVDSTEESQSYIEEGFMKRWFVEDLWRKHVGNDDGSDSTGWVTVVQINTGSSDETDPSEESNGENPGERSDSEDREEVSDPEERMSGGNAVPASSPTPAHGTLGLLGALLGLLLVGATVSSRLDRYRSELDTVFPPDVRRAIGLGGGIVLVYLFVRFGAIGAERMLPLAPKMIAAVFYPVIFVGIPIVTYLLARQLEKSLAFTGASVGFLTAILLDYTYLEVAVLPHDVLIHRGALAVALGLIAVGASRTERHAIVEAGHVRTGVLVWLVALGLPFLRLL